MAGNWRFQSSDITFESTGPVRVKAYVTVVQFSGPTILDLPDGRDFKFTLDPTQGLAFTAGNSVLQTLFNITQSSGSVGGLRIGDSYPADPITIPGIDISQPAVNLTFPDGSCQFNLRLSESPISDASVVGGVPITGPVLPANTTVGLELTIEVCALI